MRPHGVLQPVALVDLDPDAAGRYVAEYFARQCVLFRRIDDVVREGRPRYVHGAFYRELRGVDRRHRPRGGTDADEEAAPLERIDRALEGVLADAVVDDVDASAAGDFAHPLGDILAPIQDHVVTAVG